MVTWAEGEEPATATATATVNPPKDGAEEEEARGREAAKVPAQVLIFPKLTTGTTELGPKRAQRNYLLTLELVDISTGRDFRVSEEVRKAYR